MHLAPMVAACGFGNGGNAMANQERLDGLQTQVQVLSEQIERLKIENEELRQQQEKSEWFSAEFRTLMLDRMRKAEGQ